jgi:phosphate starvation-inducible PhoH-like protein
MQIPPETQVVIDFDDNRAASALVGPYGQNLALIERRLNVVVDSRGNHISIAGSRDGCDAARRVLEALYAQATQGHDLAQGDVEGAIRAVIAQGSLFEFDAKAPKSSFETINLRKRPVRARTAAQDSYIRALKRHEMVFGIGPAGTGKTWLAVAHAAQLFERKEVDRIILSRPAVEAGERLGFLPGDLREKVDPYLRPIYDALYDLMDSRIVERALQAGEIEIAPLAFMRGRTLTNAVIILDEAQNTTSMQMKMFLTRLGENSRMIITGDPSQVDLPNGQTSGLAEAARLLDGVEGISQVKFTAEDVIRHELVFGIGPAGTGKTWLAVAHAAQLFERKEVDRIILSRPAVEAGERLGFLPGDLREKVDPYLRPIYDALYDLMDSRIVERALQAGEIEIAPLAFMRGRTLTNAVIILDEAQNTTSMQMKMFLTRLGENSRMIITGDPSQVDLPNGQTSGLAEAAKLLDGVEGISQVKFTAEDVIRHELVARIVAAYEGLPQKPVTSRA